MALTEAQRAQIDAVVDKLAADGADHGSIQTVVDNMKQQFGGATEMPEPEHETSMEADFPVPPGIMSSLGLTTLGAKVAAPTILKGVGNAMMKHPGGAATLIGGSGGASIGASIGAKTGIGPFGGAAIGAGAGRYMARNYAKPAIESLGKLIADSATRTIPTASRRAATFMARRGVSTALKAASPIGDALLVADGLNMAYPYAKPYIDAAREDPRAPKAPVDPMVEEMLRRMAR